MTSLWCPEDAARLVHLTSGIYCMVNLIVFNPHEGTPFKRSSDEAVSGRQQRMLRWLLDCLCWLVCVMAHCKMGDVLSVSCATACTFASIGVECEAQSNQAAG